MITDLELERVAAAIERALRADGAEAGWNQVERLRLQSDLFDRLAAAQRHWTGSLSRRAELLRDSAERLADELNQVPGALLGDAEPAPPEPRGAGRAPSEGNHRTWSGSERIAHHPPR